MSRPVSLFGSEVIQLLIPHRRPLLMVDAIESFDRGANPRLRTCRQISANEEVFAGHFPELHLWPGVYTIEGLGQSCLLLSILDVIDAPTFDALRNYHLGARMHGGYRPRNGVPELDALGAAANRMGMAAAVEIKFLAPVFAGQRLDYQVTRTHVVEQMTRYEVEAEVDGRPVARGIITGRGGLLLPPAIGEAKA